MCTRIAAFVFCIVVIYVSEGMYAQAPIKCPGSLSEQDRLNLIKGEVPEARVKQFIMQCGIAFPLDAEVEKRLWAAAASAAIIAVVKDKAPPTAAKPSQDSADTVFWNSIRESNDRSLFDEYLRRFPQGVFRTLAERKLRKLRAADLRKQIEKQITTRQWVKAEEEIKELLGLIPEDEQAKKWDRQVADGMAADRAAAEKAEREKMQRAEEERATREAVASFAKDFVKISPGSFTMGCSEMDRECEKEEKPPHPARITRAFGMQKHEVTQSLWQAVMGNNPSRFKGRSRPVEQVSWIDVQEFLAKLNSVNDGFRYRLPTEVEWEYAARGGTTGPYYGGLDSVAWYSGNSGEQTHAVGEKQPNSFGLYDMLGNVWEWCEDWHGDNYYKKSPQTDPTGPPSGQYRVVRGGSWGSVAWGIRVSYRGGSVPDLRYYVIGFRCVREVK